MSLARLSSCSKVYVILHKLYTVLFGFQLLSENPILYSRGLFVWICPTQFRWKWPYWKWLKTNIKEKSELKYLQLSFLLQSVHSASISAYQTSTDMWTVLWMESWDNRLFITCNHFIYTCILLNACKHFDIKVLLKLVSLLLSFCEFTACFYADEYFLPKIAERDLRRFANLRSASSDLGAGILFHEVLLFMISWSLNVLL